MIALGIDPGTRRVGYGVVRTDNGKPTFIAAGILTIKSASGNGAAGGGGRGGADGTAKNGMATDDAAALSEIKQGVAKLIKKYRPAVVGVERLFFAKNQKTAMAVAQARGAVLLAAKESGAPIKEYAPNEMKLGITGYGFADKKAVLKMVRLILGKPALDVIDDASDALALAIMACGRLSGF